MVSLKAGASRTDREFVLNSIRGLFPDDLTYAVDTKSVEETAATTLMLFQLFVIVVGIIALTLSFFLLLTSTTANIRENMWEFGVLRSIGLTKREVERVYIYEAFCVTLSAVSLGCVVGIILALIVTAQFYMFLELPFVMAFPTIMFLTMIGLALITTFFGSYIPTQGINKREIAQILRSH